MDKAELMNIIYDTLFENKQYQQFNSLDIDNQFIDTANDTIEFEITIEDTIHTMRLSIESIGERFFLDDETE